MSDTPNIPTPRTDAAETTYDGTYHKFDYVEPDFARQLERELSTLQAEVMELKRTNQALLAHFQHYHVNNGIDDTCKECGFDLRHEIHFRAKDKQP